MREVDVNKLSVNIIDLWMKRWLLLTAGTIDDYAAKDYHRIYFGEILSVSCA